MGTNEKQIEGISKLIETMLSHHSSYHDHKERMAHGVFLFEIALFTAIMSTKNLPPVWVKSLPNHEIITFFAISIIWVMLHSLLRWQLRNRRWAAIQYAGTFNAYRRLIMNDQKTEELLLGFKLAEDKLMISKRNFKSMLMDLLDFFIPTNLSPLFSDIAKNGFPQFLVDEIQKQENNIGTGALFAEKLLTYGSLLIFIAIIIRLLLTYS